MTTKFFSSDLSCSSYSASSLRKTINALSGSKKSTSLHQWAAFVLGVGERAVFEAAPTKTAFAPDARFAQQLREREWRGARAGAVQRLLHLAAAGHVQRARDPVTALLGVLMASARVRARDFELR